VKDGSDRMATGRRGRRHLDQLGLPEAAVGAGKPTAGSSGPRLAKCVPGTASATGGHLSVTIGGRVDELANRHAARNAAGLGQAAPRVGDCAQRPAGPDSAHGGGRFSLRPVSRCHSKVGAHASEFSMQALQIGFSK
jgi:hypothetical protein